jgi:membrane associated rhomboid family serine protease
VRLNKLRSPSVRPDPASDPYLPQRRRFVVFPPVIATLLVLNGLIFLLQPYLSDVLIGVFALWPMGTPDVTLTPHGPARVPDFQLWQLVSYAFLHGNTLHLFVNMFAMWMFGVHVENTWGSARFAVYYFVCVVGAALIQLVVATMAAEDGSIYPTVGASGGVFGILLAFGMLFPNQRIVLLFPPIPLKAKWVVIFYGAFELWAGFSGTLQGVAHFAHLGGMLFGFLLILFWRGTGSIAR